ncbi:MAG: hypothetical protein ABJL44_15905 [Algibacter sp.]
MKKYITLLAIFSFLMTNAQFKKGVIYLKDGNTYEGLIKLKKFGGIKYKENEASEAQSFDFIQMKGYDVTEHGRVKFRYKKVGDFHKMMKVVRLGKINLYSVFVSNEVKDQGFIKKKTMIEELPISSGNIYYIEKWETTVRIGSKIKKGKLYLFEGCPILLEKIKKKEFKKDDIYKIVNYYINDCK